MSKETIVGVFFGDERDQLPPEIQARFQQDADGSTMWLAFARANYELICEAIDKGGDATAERQELTDLYKQLDPGMMIDIITTALQLVDRDALRVAVEDVIARDPEWRGGK